MSQSVNEALLDGTEVAAVALTDEMVRREFIKHEASVKSIGILYYLGGVIGFIAGVVCFVGGMSEGRVENLILGPVLMFIAVCQFAVGWGLRRLCGWSRIPTVILSAIGLLGFPMGTLINGYILYLIVCEKSKTVFSEKYKAIIAATPHVKYRTSIVVWILLGILILLILLIIFAALTTR